MRKMTEDNLKAAFAGESQAHMRYLIFAEKAKQDGYPNVARLFSAISYAEKVHATTHYNFLGMIRRSSENLQVAIDGEAYEVNEMYPAFNAVAKLQGEKGAERSTDWALQAKRHTPQCTGKQRKLLTAELTSNSTPSIFVMFADTL